MITVNLFLTAMTAFLILLCIVCAPVSRKSETHPVTVIQQNCPHGHVFVGNPLEPVLGIKVTTKEAGRAIIWAEDMGYQIGWDWYNGTSNVYIVFYRAMKSTIMTNGRLENG